MGSKQYQLSPSKLRGSQGKNKTKQHLDAPHFKVTEGPPDNQLVYILVRVDLEVTSKGVEGNKVRKGPQQLNPVPL